MELVKLNAGAITGIVSIYDEIARKKNIDPASIETYDCTKVEVSQYIFELVKTYYNGLGLTDPALELGMNWCCYGPRAVDELEGCVARIEDGFFKFKEVEE